MLALLAFVLHRWPTLRFARSTAHRLGCRTPTAEPQVRVGRLRTGSSIVLDLRDHQQRHIYFYGVCEPETTALVRELVRPGSTMLDVGANCGYYALMSADLGATVHAFEPQRPFAEAIRRAATMNGAPIAVVEAACGARAGTMLLYDSSDPYFSGMATLVPGYYTLSRPGKTVAVVALDDYCAERGLAPAFVKIDVEGFEAEVIAGMHRIIAEHRPTIVCEVAFDRPQSARVLEMLGEAGYDGRAIGPAGPEPLPGDGVVNVCFRPTGEASWSSRPST